MSQDHKNPSLSV
ncbi:hypothetical protein CSPAE12_00088 [Colletotrichum incanum]|nr:hypothetical protein CSPAE12_00088 [Colletotrichum incanum]